MRACKNKTAERWEHAHTCLPPEMLGNTSDPDNVHKTRQWNLSLLTTVLICLWLLWGQDDRLVHKKVWGLRTSVWSLLWLVPSVLCPRYLLCLHLSLSHTHTDTLTHTSIHSSTLIFFFFPSISQYLVCLPPLGAISSLLGASVHLCVYAKCPWQQEQTALIHHPRRGPVRWGEREASVSSRWFSSFTERVVIGPSEGGLTVKLSPWQSDYPNLKAAVMLLGKINGVLPCCSGLTLSTFTWPEKSLPGIHPDWGESDFF